LKCAPGTKIDNENWVDQQFLKPVGGTNAY
jgi:hypothetical protein